MNIPARQSERNEAFTRAVWAGDATEAERERWRIRRRLYRRAGLLAGAKAGTT